MVLGLVEPGKCCSSFFPFEKLNRSFISIKMRSTGGILGKANLLIETPKYITGVPIGVSTVISATYLVAFRDAA